MGSSGRNRDRASEVWLRWLWVPIVVPGLVLGWLAWRAVANEQALLRRQVTEGRVRLASQVAGILQGAGREFQHQASVDLVSWALEVRDAPELPLPQAFDAAALFVDGSPQSAPGDAASASAEAAALQRLFAATMSDLARLEPAAALAAAERFLMEALHARPEALPSGLAGGLDRLEKGIEAHLSVEPHWRPVFEDLLVGTRHRLRSIALTAAQAQTIARLAALGTTGLARENGHSWLVLAPPDLPEGQVVVAAFSEEHLQQRLGGDLPGLGSDSTVGALRLGLRSTSTGWFRRDSHLGAADPAVEVEVPGGFPAWSVGVWSGNSEDENAARFRAALLAALLGLSLGILVGAAWLATRSLASQRQLLSMKTDFVSNVTHELKTPLTGIFLYAELLAGGKAEGRSREFGAVVLREARRLEGMIDGILSFARQEAGHAASRRDRVELDGIVRECGESFQGVAKQRGIAIECQLQPVCVPGDPALLRSIVGNLIDNAVKYGRDGGFVRIALSSERQEALLRVSDDGRGIPREQQDRVFDRFFRGGGELTRNVPGTGLGLAIVKRAVQIHGGKIALQSDVGAGTTMEVRLPLSEEPHV